MSLTELIGGAIGCTMLALGIASVLAWTLRRPRGDRMLLWFGVWCGLYGARLIAAQEAYVAPLGGTPIGWKYFRACVTYAINVPIGLFVEALIGPGWKHSIRRVWQVQAVVAVGAIIVDLAVGKPRAAMPVNSPLLLMAIIIGIANLVVSYERISPLFKSRAIAIGGLLALVFVLNENLNQPVAHGISIEPIGVFAFVISLGYSVVAHVFRQETELVAVQRELETARQIQTSLLPRDLPHAPGLDIAVRYLPMTAVAGDLYDVIDLGASRIGVLVADVAGHGVPAALVASMVKLAFSAQADDAHDPARVLTAINRILCRHVESTYVTAIYAVIDTDQRTIRVANAGHPPLLVGRADRRVVQSEEHGLLLGILPDASYASSQIDLRDGDCVLLYTDGIPETQNARGDFLDMDRIRGWLASPDARDAGGFADAALQQLRRWRGGAAFDDDVTFVVARFSETRRGERSRLATDAVAHAR